MDWNDFNWVFDFVDVGVNYKCFKFEDVIGILILVLGVEDVFINEFIVVIVECLLGDFKFFE